MDNLKTLMNDHNFDLVLKLTESSRDATSLFYRISAYMGLSQPKECLKIIKDNKAILAENNLYLLMKMHIEILCVMGRFDDAYIEVKKYEEYPYVSQVVEEYLKELPNIIRKEERQFYTNTEIQIEDINKMLKSKNKEEILYAFSIIKRCENTPCLYALDDLLTSCPYQDIRSLGLLLLKEKKIRKNVKFLFKNKIVEVCPLHIKDFENDIYYCDTKREIRDLTQKSPMLGEFAYQNLTLYFLNNIMDENYEVPPSSLAVALLKYSLNIMGYKDFADEALLEKIKDVDEGIVIQIRKTIESNEDK